MEDGATSVQSTREDERSQPGPMRRRSDRIALELAIEVGGSDAQGRDFFEPGCTVVISRHGAKIFFHRVLSPHQEVTILCKTTGKEAAARVVGQVQQLENGYHYGIAFLDDAANPWEIEFPELTESEHAAARVLLECAACHNRKVTYLDAAETEVFEVNRRLSLRCERCRDMTIWRPAISSDQPFEEPQKGREATPPQPPRTSNERQQSRVRVCMDACLRHPQFGEEVVQTTDISRGGFGFTSRKRYEVGTVMEAAVPYLPHAGSIFCPIRVAHCEPAAQGHFHCGVAYIRF